MSSDASVPVVIVGAGQAGLAVAYYLRTFELIPGRDFVLFDRSPDAGGAWQHRWQGLRLGSAHRVNDLPGMSELGLSFATADRVRPTVSGRPGTSSPSTTAGTRSTSTSGSCDRSPSPPCSIAVLTS